MSDDTILGLRTVDKNMQSYGGFQWPLSGRVEALDWNPLPRCGGGLHALPWGEGDASLLDANKPGRIWQVVAYKSYEAVDLGGKVKFPTCEIMHVGTRESATRYIWENSDKQRRIVHLSLTGGYGSTLTGGYRSTLTGGNESTLTGGDGSTLTGGESSVLIVRYWQYGSRRVLNGIIGCDGLEPGVPYREQDGRWIAANNQHEGERR